MASEWITESTRGATPETQETDATEAQQRECPTFGNRLDVVDGESLCAVFRSIVRVSSELPRKTDRGIAESGIRDRGRPRSQIPTK